MSKITFRDRAQRESEQGTQEGQLPENTSSAAKSSSDELLEQLVSRLSNTQAPAAQEPQQNTLPDAQTLLGLDADKIEVLNKTIGEDATRVIQQTLAQSVNISTDHDSIVLQEIQAIKDKLEKDNAKQLKAIKDQLSVQGVNVNAALGFDNIFNEDNRSDVEEMLDIISDKSGGMFDAPADLNDALAKNDVARLSKYKEKFQDFSSHKYKSHESIAGSHTAPSNVSNNEGRKSESKIDSLQSKIDAELLSPNKDVNKVMGWQAEIKEELEASLA